MYMCTLTYVYHQGTCLSPDGAHIVTTGTDGFLRIWSVPAKASSNSNSNDAGTVLLGQFSCRLAPTCVCVGGRGRLVVCGDRAGGVHVLRVCVPL